ncbi:MAG: ABC transporter permease [Candidatus Sumerlaeota bacterium]|nr:ABC transporter permease [Candidatus Sumerlaeota bacterium]
MLLTQSISIGVLEIAAHKMRSMLTMLGVIFGVAAVIATVAIGAGAEQETLREISLLGTNNIRIRKVPLEGAEKAKAAKRAPFGLTMSDVAAVRELSGGLLVEDAVSRQVKATVSYEGETPPVTVLGVTRGYSEVISFTTAAGRFINQFDMEDQKRVCVIGDDVRQAVFPLDENRGLGKDIKIGDRQYTVVGVMSRKSAAPAGGGVLDVGNLNQYVMIPFSAAMAYFVVDPRMEDLDEIIVEVSPHADLQETADLIGRILQRRHEVKDFEIIIPEELLKQKQRIQRIFGYTLIAIAGISLLVGGIGIMNIMLSTVTQRTREIGVRRAIGATERDILSQFIIESLVLSIAGGILGVGLGFLLAHVISAYMRWNTPISVPAIIVSFSVSALTGLIFGLYPAMKAAQLDPIEALRYE